MAIGRQARPASSGLFTRPTWMTGPLSWLTTVDHKRLGIMYLASSFFFLGLASIEAFLIRLQLAQPNQQLVSPDVYNQLFTMHGVTMVFLAIMPMGIGLANYFVPLMIGARDLAFPRLNALGYWIYFLSGLLIYVSVITGEMPDVGWFAYAPLTSLSHNPGNNTDYYMVGLFINGIGTLVTAMNLIVTIINMRAPGMGFMRMPMFVWMIFITSFLIIFAFPPLTVALFQVIMDRNFGTLFYIPEAGGMPILWQHLFWIFGHPEVYIIILPAFGVISEVIPTYSRKPLFGYPVMVLSGIFIGFMGFAVWTHHMFTTGLGPVVNTAFAITTIIIGIPTGVKIFNWLATMWGGVIRFTTAMLFAIAFLITFTLGGITGVMLALPPFNAQAHDTYFVVAHFHYVMGGGALLAFFAAAYHWLPKMTGRMLDERLGKWVFGTVVGGFHLVFFPQHFLGLLGMPRRIQTYGDTLGWSFYNLLSTAGTFVMAVGFALFIYSFIAMFWRGQVAGNDPWDGRTLEWATSSPPPYYNFASTPVVTGLDPHWEAKYPGTMHDHDEEPYPFKEDPKKGIHMPGQSWYPFIMALALTVGGFAAIYENWAVGIAMLVVVTICIYGWAFEGVGGGHVYPEGTRSTGRAAADEEGRS
jgi:cytochrome c oxidase subunit 1